MMSSCVIKAVGIDKIKVTSTCAQHDVFVVLKVAQSKTFLKGRPVILLGQHYWIGDLL